MKQSKWDQRIARADELAIAHPFAADVLRFYKSVVGFQKTLYLHFEKAAGNNGKKRVSGLISEDLNLQLLLPRFPEFLSNVATVAPPEIARSASDLKAQPAGRWHDLLSHHWQTLSDFRATPGQSESLLAWIFLQPYAEYLADHSPHRPPNESLAVCPFCSGKPQVGVLRPEGDGAKRSLICSICATEWTYGRIVCPACDEKAVEKLAIYTADQFQHVRVEACDTCRYYIKTVDLTKNGLAVPVVDELATIPLNLWANEHGYFKLGTNLLGI